MKHSLFLFIWLAVLALCSTVVGVLAWLDYGNAEVRFWTSKAIESDAGKIAWVVVSAMGLIVFVGLAVWEWRRKTGEGEE